MNLQAVAQAIPTEWVSEDEAFRRVAAVTKTPSWDLGMIGSILNQLRQQGLVERGPGDARYPRDARRVEAPVVPQPMSILEQGRSYFHPIEPALRAPAPGYTDIAVPHT
jgi:hypothetical protein